MSQPHPRSLGRQSALELLYEAYSRDILTSEMLSERIVAPPAFVAELVAGVLDSRESLDKTLSDAVENWRLDRLAVVDLLILRMATWELQNRDQVSTATVINEAVELAKRFSGDDSGKFVNGVLGRVAALLRSPA